MNENITDFACSEHQFVETLESSLVDFAYGKYRYRLKKGEKYFILKPLTSLQKQLSLVNCRFELENLKDNRIRVKVTYRLTFFAVILLLFILVVLYNLVKEIINHCNFEILFGMILFIAVPTFFVLLDRMACRDFIDHFFKKLRLLHNKK